MDGMNAGTNKGSGGVFLTIKPRDTSAKDFGNRHFLLDELVTKLVGAVESASVDPRSGNYVILVRNEIQAERLCRAQKLKDGFKIKVERNTQLNKAKVVIRSDMIAKTTDKDLQLQLSKQGVIEVKAISADLKTRVITFKRATAPETVKIGLIPIPTEKFYPPPILCWNCMRLGHTKGRCIGKRRCARCSGEHEVQECTNPPACINCKGNHQPRDKSCPAYWQEKKIVKIQIDSGCSAKAARRQYRKRNRSTYYHETDDSAPEEPNVPDEASVPEEPDMPSMVKTPEVHEAKMMEATGEAESDGEVEMVASEDGKPPTIPRPIGSDTRPRKAPGSRSARKDVITPKAKPSSSSKPGGPKRNRLRLSRQRDEFRRACERLEAEAAKSIQYDEEDTEAAPPAKRATFSDVSSDEDRSDLKTMEP